MHDLNERLAEYQKRGKIVSKGKLAATLFVSRLARDKGLPLDQSLLLTNGGGQVLGLGKAAVQAILRDHGELRILAEEAGRTSRGSLGNMEDYVEFLNQLHCDGLADAGAIESWWVERVKDFFSAKPFALKYDTGKSLRSIVRDLLAQAAKRQKDNPGTMYAGAVAQHLVGAKLSLILPQQDVVHHGFSVSDATSARSGDFAIDDVVIHVTTMPGEALMRKCKANIEAGFRPIVITTYDRMPAADSLAAIQGIEGWIDIVEVEQFVATNIYEISKFKASERKFTIEKLISEYNSIVSYCETDPSLQISIG